MLWRLRRLIYLIPVLFGLFGWALWSVPAHGATDELALANADGALKDRIRVIRHIAMNLSIVSAVKRQNAEQLSLEVIKKRDEEWKQSKNVLTPLKRQLMQGQAGEFLRRIVQAPNSRFNEVFLTDNQGANVAVYPPTSDYWQGDEEKWSRSFNQGQGQVYIGPVEKDESTQTKAVQISVPVLDHGKTIGVLVVGVKVE